jgi:hypothetical protein
VTVWEKVLRVHPEDARTRVRSRLRSLGMSEDRNADTENSRGGRGRQRFRRLLCVLMAKRRQTTPSPVAAELSGEPATNG